MAEQSCQHYAVHEERLNRNDERLGGIEDDVCDIKEDMGEMKVLVARIDTLVASMNKMYWIVASAVVGSLVASVLAMVSR